MAFYASGKGGAGCHECLMRTLSAGMTPLAAVPLVQTICAAVCPADIGRLARRERASCADGTLTAQRCGAHRIEGVQELGTNALALEAWKHKDLRSAVAQRVRVHPEPAHVCAAPLFRDHLDTR